MKIGKFLLVLCALAVPFTLSGCNSEKAADNTSGEHGHDHDHGDHDHGDHGHEHGGHSHDEGPHGGHLIELGGEKYHLEWAHDDEAKLLTFYVLDADAKEEVAIPAEAIMVNITVGEDTKPYEIPAVRKEGETTTATFESADADLFALIEDEDTKATVVLEIEGTPYNGTLEHHHH
ncbi:hypothetical protein AB1L30_08425 [Bremerella sp. JC817]|uniref:hypothetical protein n=1 Tax=Bremerella sp. JC817 TaxID=3231756 RepID=UPI0034585EA3